MSDIELSKYLLVAAEYSWLSMLVTDYENEL